MSLFSETESIDDDFEIDKNARIPIVLEKHTDKNGKPFYTGKFQANVILDFEAGQSFMVFTADDDVEEIQLGPVSPTRRNTRSINRLSERGERVCIELTQRTDRNDKVYHTGTVFGSGKLNAKRGLFFTVFLSEPGKEEIQISRMRFRRNHETETYVRKASQQSQQADDLELRAS